VADETGEAVCTVFFRQIVLIDIDDGWFAVCAGVAVVQREKAVSVVFLGEKVQAAFRFSGDLRYRMVV